ncbi:alpha/beta fold hydrolase [Saccharopolyspora sp. 5N708]|uniref:alpha/beta fold hydrolase n=1 Tax=Saccharopolyspora sp. 5N708 TaxID=3457424 RepID=UPI003FD28180
MGVAEVMTWRGDPDRLRAKLAAQPGMRTVRRPVTPDGRREFDLSYIRCGPRTDHPVLVIPGGPGLASVCPYQSLRANAIARNLDVLMVEHRGVGLSREDADGVDLPPSALTVDQVVADLAAVLDDCGVRRAVVYGSSYGSYLAQGFGARHPERVAGMVLDSPMLTAQDGQTARTNLRRLFWQGAEPHTAAVARKLRALVRDGVVPTEETGTAVQVVYEFGGIQHLERLLDLLGSGRGRRTWNWLAGLGVQEIGQVHRFTMEHDLVGVISFRELGYQPDPDGLALDPNLVFLAPSEAFPPFEGEPYDLPAELPRFDWPTAVISGDRDLRTPRPIAERIVDLLPDAVLVPLADLGHSALDTHQLAALHVTHAVANRTHRRLPQLAERIGALPRRGTSRLLGTLLGARLATEGLLPARSQPQAHE